MIISIDSEFFHLADKQWLLKTWEALHSRGMLHPRRLEMCGCHEDHLLRYKAHTWGLERQRPLLYFFTPPILCPNPPPLLTGFLLVVLSADYGVLGMCTLIPPFPIKTTLGVRAGAQRGDLHTMIWITGPLCMSTLIPPPRLLSSQKCAIHILLFSQQGTFGFLPKPFLSLKDSRSFLLAFFLFCFFS